MYSSGNMLQPQLTPEQKLTIDLLIVIESVKTDLSEILASLKAGKIDFSYEVISIDRISSDFFADRVDSLILFYPQVNLKKQQKKSKLLKWLEIAIANNNIPPIIISEALIAETLKQWQELGRVKIISKHDLYCLSETIEHYLAKERFNREKQPLKHPVRKQKKREQLIYQIGKKLNSILEPETVLEYIATQVGETFNVERVIVCHLEADRIEILQQWRSQKKIPLLRSTDISIARDRTIKTEPTPLEIDIINETIARSLEDRQLHSILSVPIAISQEYYGSLILQKIDKQKIFILEEINTIQIVAELIAIAVTKIEAKKQINTLVEEKAAALEGDRLKSELIAHVSHELRNPLTAILGFARMLGDEIYGSLNPKQMQYIKAISGSGNHLLELINDLLDLSKIEADREELYLEEVEIEEVARSSMSIVQGLARQKGLELELNIEPSLIYCQADRRRLKQILVNLLSNAVKFTEVGKVTLEVKQNDRAIEFNTIDTGIGIDEVNQEKIFEPFTQIRNHLSKKYQGTGLGLPLSAKLARLHGGNLTVTSVKGQGSCFTLHLPKQ